MPLGPGKYDDLCSHVRAEAKARGVAVIVLGGDKGNGFSVQGDAVDTLMLPDLLEVMAAEIRASLKRGKI